MTDPQRDPLRPNGHSKVSYPPEWFDPDPRFVPEESTATTPTRIARSVWVVRTNRDKPAVSRGVQRWVLFALGLGIGLVLGWRWG